MPWVPKTGLRCRSVRSIKSRPRPRGAKGQMTGSAGERSAFGIRGTGHCGWMNITAQNRSKIAAWCQRTERQGGEGVNLDSREHR